MDNDYSKEILKQSVARACAALGMKQARYECVEILADVLRNFIAAVADTAHENAELAGRACAGIHDVMPAVENANPQHCKWKDLKAFAFDEDTKDAEDDEEKLDKWNQPFPFEIPNFPIEPASTSNNKLLGNEISGNKRDQFVPSHLPAYPLAHTYKRSSGGKKRGLGNADSNRPEKKQKQNLVLKSARQSLAKIESAADN